jgi:hypothetical protein
MFVLTRLPLQPADPHLPPARNATPACTPATSPSSSPSPARCSTTPTTSSPKMVHRTRMTKPRHTTKHRYRQFRLRRTPSARSTPGGSARASPSEANRHHQPALHLMLVLVLAQEDPRYREPSVGGITTSTRCRISSSPSSNLVVV